MTPFLYRHPIEAHTVAPDLTDAEREVVERFGMHRPGSSMLGGDALRDYGTDLHATLNPDRDTFTASPDAAAAYERHHGDDADDDRPTLAEAERDDTEFDDDFAGLDGYDRAYDL